MLEFLTLLLIFLIIWVIFLPYYLQKKYLNNANNEEKPTFEEYISELFEKVSNTINEQIQFNINNVSNTINEQLQFNINNLANAIPEMLDKGLNIPELLVETLNQVLPEYMGQFQENIIANLKELAKSFIPGMQPVGEPLTPEEEAELKDKSIDAVNKMATYGIESQLPDIALGVLQQVWPTWKEDYNNNPRLWNSILDQAQQRGLFNLLGRFQQNQGPGQENKRMISGGNKKIRF